MLEDVECTPDEEVILSCVKGILMAGRASGVFIIVTWSRFSGRISPSHDYYENSSDVMIATEHVQDTTMMIQVLCSNRGYSTSCQQYCYNTIPSKWSAGNILHE